MAEALAAERMSQSDSNSQNSQHSSQMMNSEDSNSSIPSQHEEEVNVQHIQVPHREEMMNRQESSSTLMPPPKVDTAPSVVAAKQAAANSTPNKEINQNGTGDHIEMGGVSSYNSITIL